MRTLTKAQIQKKYAGVYVDVYRRYDGLYEVRHAYKTIHENTTLGEDVGTTSEYTR